MASKDVRRFTLEQANKALPLVRRIVADIVKTHAQASTIVKRWSTPAPRAMSPPCKRTSISPPTA